MIKKINEMVSYYIKPVFGTVKAEKRVMALSVDKLTSNPYLGIIREITKSKGSVDIPGFVDESKLILAKSSNALSWEMVSDFKIKGIEKIIQQISGNDKYFIGLEDPDIWTDEQGLKHVYFTIAFKYKYKFGYKVYLGHAKGKNLNDLIATSPVLSPIKKKNISGFKELCISSQTKIGKINLTETEVVSGDEDYSAIASVIAKDMNKPWEFNGIALNPKKIPYSWCNGHVSPCCFLPKDFLSIDNLLVCIINGREPEKSVNNQKVYGKFRPGLILYNPENGKIPWVSPEPLFEDPDARTITFASDFLRTKDKGILYAHVNDSFIRAYELNPKEMKKYIEKNFK